MKFSEYLRKLDEGNLGHELEKQEAAKPKVGKNLQKIAAAKPAETADDNAKRKEWRDSLRSTGDDGGAKAARENTVKEPNGETMLDPKTGKPFPKTGPLKDWQIPSLRESERPGEAINYGRDEEDGAETSRRSVITNPKHPDFKPKHPTNVRRSANKAELTVKKSGLPPLKRSPGDTAPGFISKPKIPSIRPHESDADTAIRDRMKDREAGEQKLKDTIAYSEAKRKANESVEIPMRDALGRLSIYSMTESSTPKPLRKALKKANMGKELSNKESGRVMRNTKADMSTRTNAADNYKNPQDDIDANDAAEGEYRSGGEGTPRQKHLDK